MIDHFGKQTVITTDLLVEGVHFDLMYTPLKHLGYKTVVVNVSDIYAMNATPTQIILGLVSVTVLAWKRWMNFMKAFMQPVNIMRLI